jgi:RimJ/RimL family protein N-acetyltransferase
MPASLHPPSVKTPPPSWAVPIPWPVAPPEARDSTRVPNFRAHEEVFTFVRASWSDTRAIEEMFKRCSIQALHRRFFRPLPSAPRGYVEEVLADRDNRHAFVARHNDETIGLAELHLEGPWSGTLALIIEDQYQRRGVGTAAFSLLLRRARELGLRMLTADVLFENAALLRAFQRVGPASVSRCDNILHIELDLEPAASAKNSKAG